MVVPPKHPKMIIFSRKTHGCYHIEDSNWGDVAWSECTESCLAAAAQRDGQVCFCWGHDWKIWRIGIVKL